MAVNVLRPLLLFAIIGAVYSQDDVLGVIESIFGDPDAVDNEIPKPGCDQVVGRIGGCSECYPCQHSTILYHKMRGNSIKYIQLNNRDCKMTTVCCVDQLLITDYRIGGKCGLRNPEGKGPRISRSGPREVLQGEYPWKAYILRKNTNEVLCGATLIDEESLSLLTTAKCVRGLSADILSVSFYRPPVNRDKASDVLRVIVHEKYNEGTGVNNIAVISLRDGYNMPHWALPACVPKVAPPHATACITIADNDYFINTVIPLRKRCTNSKSTELCSFIPPGDYTPRHGSGLYCENLNETPRTFTLYGIATTKVNEDEITFTQVHVFYDWLIRILEK